MTNEFSAAISSIDYSRFTRAKEISTLSTECALASSDAGRKSLERAFVVGCYAHWEGFFSDCVSEFLKYLRNTDRKVSEISWLLLVGRLAPEFQSLFDRRNSREAQKLFVERLKGHLSSGFDEFDSKCISPSSNLDYKRLVYSFDLIGIDASFFAVKRNIIDRQIVGWRHAVAHGNLIDLDELDLEQHKKTTLELMGACSDRFIEKIYEINY